ncbi:MAG: hypothetical protein U0992_10480 [Planctomycetaceae bacterium]
MRICECDETEAEFRKESTNFELFHDVAEPPISPANGPARLFAEAVARNAEAAARLYHVAERYPIAAGEYRLCGQFLDPEKRLEFAAHAYKLLREFEAGARKRQSTTADSPAALHQRGRHSRHCSC